MVAILQNILQGIGDGCRPRGYCETGNTALKRCHT